MSLTLPEEIGHDPELKYCCPRWGGFKHLVVKVVHVEFWKFVEQKSEWFLKDHVTEDWSNDAEHSALITGINAILQYFHIY